MNAGYLEVFQSAIDSVFETGHVLNGNHLQSFEEAFARYQGVENCIGVANGLDAMTLILRALKIGPGDEVIVPAFTFIATWFAISLVGATPVPVDVNNNALLDPDLVRAAIGEKTKAILSVDLFGQMSHIQELRTIAEEFGIFLIEDAAQAHGAERDGIKAGQMSIAAAFSFYPTKNLGALGDAGAVLTQDLDLAKKVREIANYGSSQKYIHHTLGVNSRMDEIQAFFLEKKLHNLSEDNLKRSQIAKKYEEACKNSGIEFISQRNGSVYHLFVVMLESRSKFQNFLKSNGVSTLIHYPESPLESHVYFDKYEPEMFPNAQKFSKSVLSLPLWPNMKNIQVEYVCSLLETYMKSPVDLTE